MPSLASKEGVTTIPRGSRIAIDTQFEAVRLTQVQICDIIHLYKRSVFINVERHNRF